MGVVIPVLASELSFRFALEGDAEPMVVTLGLMPVSLPDPEAFALNAQIESSTSGMIFAATSILVGYSFLGVHCTTMLPSGPVTFEENDVIEGTVVGAPLPSNCAVLIRKNTALGGRRNRGRFFLPPFGIIEDNVDARGNLNSTSFLQGLADDWFTALQDNVALPPLALLHSDGGEATPITGFTVDSRIATQRRRMR